MTPNEILSALSLATEAFNCAPELQATIKRLEEDLAFARLEIEEANAKIAKQRERIDALAWDNSSLESSLAIERDRNSTLETKIYTMTVDANESAATIRTLEVDASHWAIMVELLEADKTALLARLERFEGMEGKLREALSSVSDKVISKVAPAAKEVAAQTFPIASAHNDSADSNQPFGPSHLVETVRVAQEESVTETFGISPIGAEIITHSPEKAEPKVSEFGYNPFNRF